jgi:hypothetical protein
MTLSQERIATEVLAACVAFDAAVFACLWGAEFLAWIFVVALVVGPIEFFGWVVTLPSPRDVEAWKERRRR